MKILFTVIFALAVITLQSTGCSGTTEQDNSNQNGDGGGNGGNNEEPLLRGTWFWGDTERDFGNVNVVGDADQEDLTINHFQNYGIKRVYGSYNNRTVTDADTIAAWNRKLHDQEINSYYLMGETVWVCDWSEFLDKVRDRFITFNNARSDPDERFDGLHLDIEPHALDGSRSSCPYDWSELSIAKKQGLLEDLRDLFADLRTFLDQNGASNLPVYADLPVWYDNVSGQSFYWDSETERDQWFDALGDSLAGISLMAYCRETLTLVQSGVDWEVDNFSGEIRVGLNAYDLIGSDEECETWNVVTDMLVVAEEIEAAYGPSIGIDIHSFSRFMEELGY